MVGTRKKRSGNNGPRKGCCFVERVAKIPAVEDAYAALSQKYHFIKTRNRLLGVVLGGVETGVITASNTSYRLSKLVIPYGCVDRLACGGLNKVEQAFPYITKPVPQAYEEFKDALLSFLSGVEEEARIPAHLVEAMTIGIVSKIRRAYVDPTSSTESIFRIVARNVIESLDSAVDYMFPPTTEEEVKKLEDDLIKVVTHLIGKIKKRITEAAKYLAEEEKRAFETILSLKDIVNVIEHGLENIQKNLKEKKVKGIIPNALRVAGLSVVGMLLIIISASNKLLSSKQAQLLAAAFKRILRPCVRLVQIIARAAYSRTKAEIEAIEAFLHEHVFRHIWISLRSIPNIKIALEDVPNEQLLSDRTFVNKSVNTSRQSIYEELSDNSVTVSEQKH